jgi:choline-glycine betaine transporter
MKEATIKILKSIAIILVFPFAIVLATIWSFIEFLSQAYDDIIKPLKTKT